VLVAASVLTGGAARAASRAGRAAPVARNAGTDIADAITDRSGHIYEDDQALPSNYSMLPAFWATEVTDAAAGS
jgi:hypothetical protein